MRLPADFVLSFVTASGNFAMLERKGLLLGYWIVCIGLKSVGIYSVFTGIALITGDFDLVGNGDLWVILRTGDGW